MLTLPIRLLASLRRFIPASPAAAVGVGAWALIASSLFALVYVITAMDGPLPDGASYIFGWDEAGRHVGATGLTYHGTFGMLLAVAQVATLIVASVASCLNVDRIRRAGLVTLCAWAGLWVLGSAQQAAGADHPMITATTLAYGVMGICTVARAVRLWPARSGRKLTAPETAPVTA